jgi:hypothetical protein
MGTVVQKAPSAHHVHRLTHTPTYPCISCKPQGTGRRGDEERAVTAMCLILEEQITLKLQEDALPPSRRSTRRGCAGAALYGTSAASRAGLSTSTPPRSIRASPVTIPARPPTPFFFIRTAKNGSVAPPDPRFRPDLGLHPAGEPRPSPSFRGALGESGRKKCARNIEEISRASCGPELSAREGGRRPYCLVFRASLSSPRIVFRAL